MVTSPILEDQTFCTCSCAVKAGKGAGCGFSAVLEQADTRTRAAAAGVELRYLPPAQLDAMVKRETEFWGKTIKAAGITNN